MEKSYHTVNRGAFDAAHYQLLALDWCEIVQAEQPNHEIRSADQCAIARHAQTARCKMGLVESDYDFA